MSKLRFPGVAKFVDDANATHNLSPDKLAAAKADKAVSRAQQALEGAIEGAQTAAHQNACVAEALRWRDALVVAADGIERAILAVTSHYGLETPEFTKSEHSA